MSERFRELLPWYVNGTLDADDRAFVEGHLAAHPQARAELAWFESLATRVRDAAPAVPDTIGLDKALARIRAGKPGFGQRLAAFLNPAGLFEALGVRPATAFAGLAVFALQGAVIVSLLQGREVPPDDLRAARATAVDDRPMLKINFAPDARETDIRLLLVSVQGRLAGGPGQLGDYYVVVPPGKEEASAERLKTHPIVQAVTLAPGLPPRGE